MFIRGRHPDPVIWRHFRADQDYFVFGRRPDGVFQLHVRANADRVVDLLVSALEYFPPAVALRIEHWRDGQVWHGEALPVAEVRDAITRIRSALSTLAGVEIAISSDTEQATLTANLDLFVFAKSDRWLYLAQGRGLQRTRHIVPRSWELARGEFAPAPEMDNAIALTQERLSLIRMDVADV